MEVHALTNVLESVQLIYLDPFAIIVSACNLLIIFLIIKKFLYKPVMKIMKEREDQIQSQYDDADKAKKEAEESKKEKAKGKGCGGGIEKGGVDKFFKVEQWQNCRKKVVQGKEDIEKQDAFTKPFLYALP